MCTTHNVHAMQISHTNQICETQISLHEGSNSGEPCIPSSASSVGVVVVVQRALVNVLVLSASLAAPIHKSQTLNVVSNVNS